MRGAYRPVVPKGVEDAPGGEIPIYHLDDQIVVLAIRSFSGGYGCDPFEFMVAAHTLIKGALTYLTANHYKRFVTRVPGTGGEFVGLGIETLRQLFPDEDNFALSMRWNPAFAAMLTRGQDTGGSKMRLERISKA